jgi:hypothetical protein
MPANQDYIVMRKQRGSCFRPFGRDGMGRGHTSVNVRTPAVILPSGEGMINGVNKVVFMVQMLRNGA